MEPNVYEEEHIIECNRDRSETSDTGNSAWTTALGDTVHIEPGDKISMYAGYVNARGCGTQGRTIEVKGDTENRPDSNERQRSNDRGLLLQEC